MMKTERLILRQWKEEDFLPFSKMCSDKDVMEFFPKVLTKEESDSMGRKIQSLIEKQGWGFWAVEVQGTHQFIGFVGLHKPTSNMPFLPCVEIGWRLSKAFWGNGYATEAAKKVLDYAFNSLELEEVVSFTTLANQRSQGVMQKIGMQNSGQNFMHPDIDSNHPQCEHVLYKITKSAWAENAF